MEIIEKSSQETELRPGLSHEAYLFMLAANTEADLLADLAEFQQSLTGREDLTGMARRYYLRYRANPDAAYRLALVGQNRQELTQEAGKAGRGLPAAFTKNQEWKTPLGSYFTPAPLGKTASLAFVYPGAFNSYIGMEQGLFEKFPGLYQKFARRSLAPDTVLNQDLFGHTGAKAADPAQLEALNEQLQADAAKMILSGTSFSVLLTLLLQDYFKVQPGRAFGYSLGETSMLWSLGVWTAYQQAGENFRRSPLFQTRLTGPKESVREQWGIPAGQDFWATYFLMAPLEKVRQALQTESRVYLTHINTPEEVVISGETAGCRRVIERLKCHFLQRPHSFVLHCEPAWAEEAEFHKIYSFPVRPQPGLKLYSAAIYGEIPLEEKALAQTLTRMACQPVDFPRLVNRVYEGGARIFVELGPGNTCARWINKILRQQPHQAIAANQKGTSPFLAILKVLARLAAHRVPLELGILYGENSQAQPRPSLPDLGLEKLQTNATRLAEVHASFLAGRRTALSQMRELLGSYYEQLGQPPTHQPNPARQPVKPGRLETVATARPALFSRSQIEEFATGSVVKCFGPEYAVYNDRRVSRIPNGDLLVMSRITEIGGQKQDFEGVSSIVAEYDVPNEAWFYADNSYPYLPYCLYLEIALQPCGFLAAYKGSSLLFADKDLYFRNLDGQATILRELDLRGKTVTTRARLLSTAMFDGTIIQRFEFETACGAEVFFRGESSFGFFSREVMLRQVGLDGGKEINPWLVAENSLNRPVISLDLNAPPVRQRYFQASPARPFYRLPTGQLDFLDEVRLVPGGGKYDQGYIFASRAVNPQDWFYGCHFYQDPVMPGSLGIEAILEAMQAYALQQDLAAHMHSPRFGIAAGQAVGWKYRGQITPDNRQMYLEIHLKRVETSPGLVRLVGDASLWKDGLRIYELSDLALAITDSPA